MNAKTADDTYLFHSVEEGRRGQCYFFHEETRKKEAEQWLNRCFNGILQEHRADACKRVLGEEAHVRRENQVRDSPKIAAYLQGLNLTTTLPLRAREDRLQVPSAKKTKTYPLIRFGKEQPGSVWGNLHATDDAPPKIKVTPKQTQIDLTEGENTEMEGASSEVRGIQDTLESTLDSTVSSLQSSFQKEVERANKLRREATEATAQLLLDIQTTANDKLTAMDTTIKIVHEGHTLNDTNIQILMKKMNMLGD